MLTRMALHEDNKTWRVYDGVIPRYNNWKDTTIEDMPEVLRRYLCVGLTLEEGTMMDTEGYWSRSENVKKWNNDYRDHEGHVEAKQVISFSAIQPKETLREVARWFGKDRLEFGGGSSEARRE